MIRNCIHCLSAGNNELYAARAAHPVIVFGSGATLVAQCQSGSAVPVRWRSAILLTQWYYLAQCYSIGAVPLCWRNAIPLAQCHSGGTVLFWWRSANLAVQCYSIGAAPP